MGEFDQVATYRSCKSRLQFQQGKQRMTKGTLQGEVPTQGQPKISDEKKSMRRKYI